MAKEKEVKRERNKEIDEWEEEEERRRDGEM